MVDRKQRSNIQGSSRLGRNTMDVHGG
jgi:hypothetical protein